MGADIKNKLFSKEGRRAIEWSQRRMPVLTLLRTRFKKKKPLDGVRLGACLHVTAETANLLITLKEAGARVALCASNPLSTQDAVAASLVSDFGISTFAIKGEDNKTYYKHLNAVLDTKPNMTMDDGADLVSLLHGKRKNQAHSVIGSTEETTTGVIRLRALEKQGLLKIPVLAVNDNLTKHLFDNRYGTGQSTLDGIIRATNVLIAGKTFVVVGFGWCGRGVAARAHGLGANVIVCEVDPIKALEAKMEGFRVMPMSQAIAEADLVLATTGNKHVIDKKHLEAAKDGVILAQSGHFDIEINKDALAALAKKITKVKEFVTEYDFGNKKIYLLAEGRLVNLAAAEGHPPDVMDMSFAGQAVGAKYMWEKRGKLEEKVYQLPVELDREIALLKLEAEGVKIDKLTPEQVKYLSSWQEGT